LDEKNPTNDMIVVNTLYVVVDPKYYTNAHITRGDIIYYDTSENDQKLGFDISRVIGFYSNAHWGGLDFKTFQEKVNNPNK
jgi:hypothetical protein